MTARRWPHRDGRSGLLLLGCYLGLGAVAARPTGRREQRVLKAVNRLGGEVPLLRVPQQLGTPWVLPGIALVGFCTHRPRLTVAAGLALPVEKVLEVGVKALTRRRRPAGDLHDVELHDDAPVEGSSYPSGHAAIAFATVVLLAPYVGDAAAAALLAGAVLTALTRVHQGAHYPLDAVGGVLLGGAVGWLLRAAFGLPD